MGCGCCKSVCENGAINLKMTMPMRESLHEYFLREGSIDMKMDRCSMEPPAPDYEWKPTQFDPLEVMKAAGKTAREAPTELATVGPLAYAKAHPAAVGAAAFGIAAAAHLIAHRK